MSTQALLAVVVLVGALVCFASDRLRLDGVALGALVLVALLGLVPLDEALAGFASPAVVTIAGLFVVGGALGDVGVADWLGRRLERLAGASEARAVVAVLGVTSLLSAFMSSTGTVAVLLPVVGTLARRRGFAPALLFLPLAFGAHLGSNLLLISTAPNVLVSDALRAAGRAPFGFFGFLGPGLVVLVVGVAYLAVVAARALRPRGDAQALPRGLSVAELAEAFELTSALASLRIQGGSPLVGLTLARANVRADHGVTIVSVLRRTARGLEAARIVPGLPFAADDLLRVLGDVAAVEAFAERFGLAREPAAEGAAFALPPEETLAEVVVPRRSRLVGKTVREAKFRDRYRASALALRRGRGADRAVHAADTLRDLPLEVGDTLLVKGRARYLGNLRDERADLVLVAEPDAPEDEPLDPRRAGLALAVTGGMLAAMAFGWVPSVVAVLLAVLVLVATGCARPADAYRWIGWESVVLVAGMLPLAAALERTGAMGVAVAALEGALHGVSPWLVLALLTFGTSALGMVLSNTATAVLVAPVAVRLATALGIAPEPLLLAVAFASSAAFATPIASPVNALVMGPGGYRFGDFVRVGLPLQILVLIVTVAVVPLFYALR